MAYKGYVHEGMVQGFVLGKLVKYDLRVIRLSVWASYFQG